MVSSRSKTSWIKRKGKMGGKGFLTSFSKTKQHKVIDKCVKKHGYKSCLGSILVLSKNKKVNKKYGSVIKDLKNYTVKKHSRRSRRKSHRRLSRFGSKKAYTVHDTRLKAHRDHKAALKEEDLLKHFEKHLKHKYYRVKNISKMPYFDF